MQAKSPKAARYDSWFETPAGRAVEDAEATAILTLLAPRAGQTALDAGCGTGVFTRHLVDRGLVTTGLDADPEMLQAARLKLPGTTFVEGDLTALPFSGACFDVSMAVTVLCFIEDPHAAVSELVRVTKPGGKVLLAELNSRSAWAIKRRLDGWRGSSTWRRARFFPPSALARLLTDAGTADVRTAAAAYFPPGAPEWVVSRAASWERRASRLGSFGAALSLAAGVVGGKSRRVEDDG